MISGPATLGVVAAALLVLLLGYGVVGTLMRVPATSAGARKVWPILNAEAMIVAVVLITFLFAPWLMPLAFVLFTLRIVWEGATVRIRPGGAALALIWAGAAAGVLVVLMILLDWRVAVGLLALAWVGAALWRALRPGAVEPDLLVFPVLPTMAFALACSGGPEALFLAAWIGIETFDSYALLAGKVFGRRKAFPILSPNKTIEGLAGGAIMLILTALVAAAVSDQISAGQALGFALLIGVFTVTGDLAASRIKRAAGVKDYPKLVAHQGGLFDIFDSWIATGGALAVTLVLGIW